ncbi:EAL domain-containing protein [Thermovibrio ammonificans]
MAKDSVKSLVGKYERGLYLLLGLVGLVGLFCIIYIMFFRHQIEDAVYTSVLNQSRTQLENQVSQIISLIEREEQDGINYFKSEVKQEVENAWAVAQAIYLYGKAHHFRDSTIKELIKQVLSKYSYFNGQGYIFIDSVKGTVILNPKFPQIEGKNFWNWKDLKGQFVHRKFEEIALYAPNNEGFVTYYWYLPGTKKPDEKIAFVKLFKPYNWIIGGGVYRSYINDWVMHHVLTISNSFNVFILDNGKRILREKEYKFLKGLTLDQLKEGVLIKTPEKFYYLKYYPEWDWIVGAYITGNEILRKVFYLKEQFLSTANRIVIFLTLGIFVLVVIVSGGLYHYYTNLVNAIKELAAKRRDLLKMARSLRIVAYKDEITGLANRRKFFEDLRNLEGHNLHFAIVNIRNFRDLNELFGFEGGNRILAEFASTLRRVVKARSKGDCKRCRVYRIRGDKFGVLGCDFNDSGFLDFIKKVIKNLESKDFSYNNVNFKLDVVAGISKNKDNMLIEAEIAEEEAKKRGLDAFMFDEDLNVIFKQLEENIKVATQLKKALAEDGVVPVFQPIVDLKTGEPVKYEALMRIKVDGEVLSPGVFLPVAKKISIYRRLSRKMMEKAFEVAKERGVRISVNLSSEDLAGGSMVNWILTALKQYGIADRITFEVVETEAFSDIKALENFYFKIKEIGAYLAIDDFGSGYSNFEYLATVKPDFIKIDGSLIKKIPQSEEVEKLIRYIVAYCKDLNIKTVAEFISSEEILEKVKELGIDYGQGFYLGKPVEEI